MNCSDAAFDKLHCMTHPSDRALPEGVLNHDARSMLKILGLQPSHTD